MNLIDGYPILKLCAEGKSNRYISEQLEIRVEDISLTINKHFGFCGFEKDLDINPRIVYNRTKYNEYRFIQECTTLSPLVTEEELQLAYKVNQLFDKAERIKYA